MSKQAMFARLELTLKLADYFVVDKSLARIAKNLHERDLSQSSIVWGAGFCTADEPGCVIPLDFISMPLAAEYLARMLGIGKIIHLVGDAETRNSPAFGLFSRPEDLEFLANSQEQIVKNLGSALGFDKHCSIRTSHLETSSTYQRIWAEASKTPVGDCYLQRQATSIGTMITDYNAAIKLGWDFPNGEAQSRRSELWFDDQTRQILGVDFSSIFVLPGMQLTGTKDYAIPYTCPASERDARITLCRKSGAQGLIAELQKSESKQSLLRLDRLQKLLKLIELLAPGRLKSNSLIGKYQELVDLLRPKDVKQVMAT